MKNKFLVLCCLLSIFSFGCNKKDDTSSDQSTPINEIDYSQFDERIIGTWYVHQSSMGLCDLNTPILIKDDYTAKFLGVDFSFKGVYENFEGTCLFQSEFGTVDFVVGLDDESNLDWAIVDINGNQDWGFAKKQEHVSGIPYSYEGKDWPMQLINEYLQIDEELPIFEHGYYYLYTGLSSLTNMENHKYCMIDLYGVQSNAREKYTQQLEQANFVMSRDNITFYQGYNQEKTIAIRISQNDGNMCIFVYYYSSLYPNDK